MISQTDKDLYKKLSILFGGHQELIQGAGGNISIKSGSEIMIKASGACLSEWDQYVVCKVPDLQILEGAGKPSMEIGFHLLPRRIIVHLHSLSCLANWEGEGLSLPYLQPGERLYEALHSVYNGESIVNLQNHGIILFAETEEEVYSLLYSLSPPSFQKLFLCLKEFYEKTSLVFLEIPNPSRFLFFKAFTPDTFLFLRRKPLRLLFDFSIEEQLKEYQEEEKTLPSVLYIGTKMFAVGSSWKKCILIRDMYDAYCKVIQNPPSKELTLEDCNDLLSCGKEAYRLR